MTHKTSPICNTPGRKVPPCCEPRQKAGQATRTDLNVESPPESILPAGYLLPPGWTMADVKRMDEEIECICVDQIGYDSYDPLTANPCPIHSPEYRER